MRHAVCKWPSNSHKPGIVHLDRQIPQDGNYRPADDIAESHGENTGEKDRRGFIFKCREVGLRLHGGADIPGTANFYYCLSYQTGHSGKIAIITKKSSLTPKIILKLTISRYFNRSNVFRCFRPPGLLSL